MSSIRPETVEKKSAVRNGIGHLFFAVLAIALEGAAIVMLITRFVGYAEELTIASRLFSMVLILLIYAQHKTASMKMPWIMLIMAFPIFGVTFYLLVGLSGSTRRMRDRFLAIDLQLFPMMGRSDERIARAKKERNPSASVFRYIQDYAGFPVFQNSDVVYYKNASEGLEAQKEELRKAEKFIFMEYHAIEDAEAWHGIQEILAEKAQNGVEVRLFYDDIGSASFISGDFRRKMEHLGIQCRVFNPVTPTLNIFFNNRDHRKITVVDGRVAFTGGYNLANEYFNITHPYGFWKDTGVRVEGDAVKSFTVMFLEMWNAIRATDEDDRNFDRFFPQIPYRAKEPGGYVQPFADSPIDNEQVGENVYISIIEQAKDYVWFVTPYLIITDEMTHAFGLAAKRGVDVRIVTPGIPDKRIVYGVTRSYYNGLVRNGVRIYEYTPGFCHEKQCVSDDRIATCGTINLDYRSLYHHFEDGCLMADCSAVMKVKEDFQETFPVCREVTEKYRNGRSRFMRFYQLVFRLIAPLL